MNNFLTEVLPQTEINKNKEKNESISPVRRFSSMESEVKNTVGDINSGNETVDYDKLIDIIFEEIVGGEKRNYIDYDEFSKVLWTTNIDKNCVIKWEEN